MKICGKSISSRGDSQCTGPMVTISGTFERTVEVLCDKSIGIMGRGLDGKTDLVSAIYGYVESQ